jgi:hypothetical protein
MRDGLARSWAGMSLLCAALAAMAGVSQSRAEEENDLREFRLGMKVADLPGSGYADFTCAAAPQKELAGWEDYAQCPADPPGLHEIRFRYDESANPLARVNDRFEGTRVGGHPVLISLLIDEQGTVDGLRIVTDPKSRLYLHKKAFLLGLQAKARYGEEGWTCVEGEPTGDEQPVGGVFLKERCEKVTATRRVTVERDLFRHAGQAVKDFVGDTKITILLP